MTINVLAARASALTGRTGPAAAGAPTVNGSLTAVSFRRTTERQGNRRRKARRFT